MIDDVVKRRPATSAMPRTLAQLRQELGITQSQLGKTLDVVQQQIWKWERAPDPR